MLNVFHIKIKYRNKSELKFFNSLNDMKTYIISKKILNCSVYYNNIYILEVTRNSFLLKNKNIKQLLLIKEDYFSIYNGIDDFTYKIFKLKMLSHTYLLVINEYNKFPIYKIIKSRKTLSSLIKEIDNIILDLVL